MINKVEWSDLERLASQFKTSTTAPGELLDPEWQKIDQARIRLQEAKDWRGLIRLRILFNDICNRDTATGSETIQQLEDAAIQAARAIKDKEHLAIFLGDKGHNLHRQGLHQESLNAFEESSLYYAELNMQTSVVRNRHMMAICYRALNQWERAFAVTNELLDELPSNDLWRGEPMQVLAWLFRDKGNYGKAEYYLRGAIALQKQSENSDLLVAGALADLGEILGLQGRFEDAIDVLLESLELLDRHKGHYNRLEARAKLKLADVFSQQGNHIVAARLLKEADELCYWSGQYEDQLWKVAAAETALYFRTGDILKAIRKARSVFQIRNSLGLSNWHFVRQSLMRVWVQLLSKFRAKRG